MSKKIEISTQRLSALLRQRGVKASVREFLNQEHSNGIQIPRKQIQRIKLGLCRQGIVTLRRCHSNPDRIEIVNPKYVTLAQRYIKKSDA